MFSISQVVSSMKSTGMIPVFYHADAHIASHIVDTAYKGGVRVVEFINRGPRAFDVFRELLKHVEQYPDLALGIGTIMDDQATQKFLDAGAHFIVSPVLKPEMGSVCRGYDKLWIPGCATLTEIVSARDEGAEVIKLFPGSVLGPKFVSSVMPVVPGLQIMPTGGVEPTEKSLSEWFKAGVICVGLGSQLLSKEILNTKDWDKFQINVSRTLEIIQRVKQNSDRLIDV